MNTFVLELWDDEGSACTFYTVRKIDQDGEAPLNETDKFFKKFLDNGGKLEDAARILLKFLTEIIGEKYGATDAFYDRHERAAHAFPPKPKEKPVEIKRLGKNFPLRLYCLRMSPQIVILFNGGEKTAGKNRDSGFLNMSAHEADAFAKRINEAFSSQELKIAANGRYLIADGLTDKIDL